MALPRLGWLTAVLVAAVGSGVASCGANPAADFCSSYGDAMHAMVAAARSYASDPAGFASTYQSTMDNLGQIRARAPDEQLRSAFDRSMFSFSVFSVEADLADFLTRADFSTNAVVLACADYGVTVTV